MHCIKEPVKRIPAYLYTAMEFYEKFIFTRTPVVLSASNHDFLSTEFSNANLATLLGDTAIEVEHAYNSQYGSTNRGDKERQVLKFTSEFLCRLHEGCFYATGSR